MRIQMCADFRLQRKNKETGAFQVLTEKDICDICPGGFTFEVDGKVIPFDWDAGATSEADGVFHYESGCGPFFNDYELSDCFDKNYTELGITREDISAKMLASVSDIQEFYVNFVLDGEDEDSGIGDNSDLDADLRIELLAITFYESDTESAYDVNESVLKKFNNN